MLKEKSGIYLISFVAGVTLMTGAAGLFSTYADDEVKSEEEIIEVIPPKVIEEEVKITYSTVDATNENVVATFESSNPDIVVTNNDGKNTYTFLDNDEFVFEYINNSTLESGSIIAKVDWIDKVIPTAEVKFDYSSLTNNSVKATIVPSEEIVVLNNEYEIEDDFGNMITGDPFEHIFDENGEFIFEFEDKAGNKGSSSAKVDWIDKVIPTATITYDILTKTTSFVTATISFDKDNVIILNNDSVNYVFSENGEFVFEFQDLAGNKGNAVASVSWIEKFIDNDVNIPENNNPVEEIKLPEADEVVVEKPKVSTKTKKTNNTQDKAIKEDKSEIVYKKLTTDNIEFELDSSLCRENMNLKKQSLNMSDSLAERFGSDCDYFKIFFENDKHEEKVVDIKGNSVLTILLDGTKKFIKIHFITEDDKVQVVEYNIVNGNKLEVKDGKIGKYLVEYENISSSEQLIDYEENEVDEDSSFNACIVICSCVIAAVFLTAIICVFIKEY